MNIVHFSKQKIRAIGSIFLKTPLFLRICIVFILFAGVGFGVYKTAQSPSKQVRYTTEQAKKDTLTITVSASGSVSSANGSAITANISGSVEELYVTNGQQVQAGDPIAKLNLDMEGQQEAAQAWASYLSAKNTLAAAQTNQYSLQAQMFSKWQTFMETAESVEYQNNDGTPKDTRVETGFTIPEKEWLAAEAAYKNQESVIAQAQAALNAAWLTYQQSSGTIVAPVPGTIADMTVQVGTLITGSSSTDGSTTGGSQTIGKVKTQGKPVVSVSVSEMDAPKVDIGNKATVTFDALPEETFTGIVTSIDTTGSTSSGVTTYPVLITLDLDNEDIFSNMSAQATIVTKSKQNVLLVPSSAVVTRDGTSMVRVLSNGRPMPVEVKIGDASDTQVEIVSGIEEGAEVVTSTVQVDNTVNQSQTTSPFSGTMRGGSAGPAGGAVMIRQTR